MQILRSCLILPLMVTGLTATFGGESREAIVQRVGDDIQYLASEKLEGRGVETKGIHLAADHIIDLYKQHGLKPGMPDGSYKQPFQVSLGKTKIKSQTGVILTGPDGRKTTLAQNQFQPLQRGKNGTGSGDLVFVGYGITSADDKYDEYKGVDVKGRILVMIRREPNQGADGGAFEGKKLTPHSYIDTKLRLAKQHNAAGIIFVNDPFTSPSADKDVLSSPSGFGTNEAGIPFVHVKQTVVDALLQQSPLKVKVGDNEQILTTLKHVTDHIDKQLQPVSQQMTGVSAVVNTLFDSRSVEAYNIVGILDAEGPLSEETIVIGGHYDHLGYGGYGSRAKGSQGKIHFGADDNATGTAAVLEMVRRVTSGPKLKRRIVFICFSGEERGLIGSKYYVSNPVIPLEKTVAMLNYDMIGTLRNNRIDVNGVGTAEEFLPIVEAADEASPLDIKVISHPMAGSDHLPFFQKQIPVMFCFTGITPRYHTPDDRFEVINVPGVVSVIDFTESLLRGIDSLPKSPTFVSVGRRSKPVKLPYLGLIPNLSTDPDDAGVPVQMVRSGSPAQRAGLKPTDVITKINGQAMEGYSNVVDFLKTAKPGQTVNVTIKRSGQESQMAIQLGQPR